MPISRGQTARQSLVVVGVVNGVTSTLSNVASGHCSAGQLSWQREEGIYDCLMNKTDINRELLGKDCLPENSLNADFRLQLVTKLAASERKYLFLSVPLLLYGM